MIVWKREGTMAKPIFIVALPYRLSDDREGLRESLNKEMPDYYHLVYSKGIDEIEFKVFYDKDFTETNYEELKEFVRSEINSLKTKTD